MNDITKQLFALIKAGDTDENLEKIKTLFILSDIAKQADLTPLTLDIKVILREEYSFNILSYACYHLNFRAIKFFLEERSDIIEFVNINMGDPPPLFLAVLHSNYNKAEQIAYYLIEKGANIKYICNSGITLTTNGENRRLSQTNLLHILINKNNIDLVKYLLLRGLDYRLEAYDFIARPTPFSLTASYYYNVPEIRIMMECLDYIKLAKEHYAHHDMTSLLIQVSLAYQKDAKFFIDYLTHELQSINLGQHEVGQDYSFLIKFIDVFIFITHSNFQQDHGMYKRFQETVLPELGGYDVQSGAIKLLTDASKKQEYFIQLSKGCYWEGTAATLVKTSPIFSSAPSLDDTNNNDNKFVHIEQRSSM